MITAGAQGRASGEGGEEMEDRAEMEAESTSNVPILAAGGTFIAGTADTTVTEVRHSEKRHRACENVSEDLLNRRIQDYGLFCPERAKNLVWCFFQKYGSKNLKSVEDNLKLSQQALCTICLTDMTRRAHCTVKLGKDNSPSSMMDHLRIHHLVEFDAVTVANSKGLTRNATANAGNAAGAARHEASMLRHGALQTLFVHTTAEQAAASGKQRPVTDMFKPSSVWTEKQDNQWQEDLVRYVAEQYLPLATVDAPAFRSMIETLLLVKLYYW